MADETEGDDGAVHHFWAFILRERLKRHPRPFAFTLEDVQRLREAIEAFDAEGAQP